MVGLEKEKRVWTATANWGYSCDWVSMTVLVGCENVMESLPFDRIAILKAEAAPAALELGAMKVFELTSVVVAVVEVGVAKEAAVVVNKNDYE